MYSPKYSWEKPEPIEENEVIGGHALYGATSYPHEMKHKGYTLYFVATLLAIVAIGAVYVKKKGMF